MPHASILRVGLACTRFERTVLLRLRLHRNSKASCTGISEQILNWYLQVKE